MIFLCDSLINQRQLISCKGRIFCHLEIIQDLLRTGGPSQYAGHDAVAQDPSQRHLRQGLAALRRQIVQRPDLAHPLLGQSVFVQKTAVSHDSAISGNAFEVTVCQQSMRQRREGKNAFNIPLPFADEQHAFQVAPGADEPENNGIIGVVFAGLVDDVEVLSRNGPVDKMNIEDKGR